MARYIDAEKLEEALRVDYDREGKKSYTYAAHGDDDLSVKYGHGQFCYLNAMERVKDAPTADVVPRALAEEQSVLWRDHFNSIYETAKVTLAEEVAREIFEEIEKTLNRKIRLRTPEYESLEESFEKLSDCGHSNHGYCKGIISTCEDLLDLIDELKKKYTEGKNDT